MRRTWQAWVELTSRREHGRTLALFRVAVALVVLYSLLSITAAGLVDVLWVDAKHGGYRALSPASWLLRLAGGARPEAVWPLVYVGMAGALFLAVGLWTRIAALVTLQAYLPLITINGDTSGGYDLMITNALWLLVLGDASATLSVDAWRRHRHWRSDDLVAAWPRYLIILQLVVVYTWAGLHKLSADWTPLGSYSALYWVFQDPTWRRFDMSFAAWVYPALQALTAVTWWWEVLAPLLLLFYWLRHTVERGGRLRGLVQRYDHRWVFAGIGVGLHLSILATFNVGPFSWISLAYYVCLLTPEEWARVGRRVAGAFRPLPVENAA